MPINETEETKTKWTMPKKENHKREIQSLLTADEVVRKVQAENKTAPQKMVQLQMALELGRNIQRVLLLLEENEDETNTSKETQKLMAVLAGLGAKMRWLQKLRRMMRLSMTPCVR